MLAEDLVHLEIPLWATNEIIPPVAHETVTVVASGLQLALPAAHVMRAAEKGVAVAVDLLTKVVS